MWTDFRQGELLGAGGSVQVPEDPKETAEEGRLGLLDAGGAEGMTDVLLPLAKPSNPVSCCCKTLFSEIGDRLKLTR